MTVLLPRWLTTEFRLVRRLLPALCAAAALCASLPARAAVGVCDTANNIDVESSGGTAQAGYATLGAAFTAINAGTHTGVINIEVCADTTESVSAVLNASGSGSASYSSIAINPVGGAARTISGTVTGHLVDLNGADNVTIDGLNTGSNALTISNAATGTSSALRFIADASNNIVQNVSLAASTTTTAGVVFFSTGTSTGNDNNNINNCNIGPAGSNLPLNGIVSTGTSSVVDNSGNTVNANRIFDYFSAGSVTNGMSIGTGNSTWTITGNRLYQTGTRTYTTANTHNGILITSGSGYTITGNIIGFADATGAGTTNLVGNSVALTGFPASYTATGTANATRYIAISAAFTAGGAASSIQNNTIAGFALYTSSGATTTNGILCGIAVTAGNANIGTTTGNTIGATTGTGSLYAATSTTGGVIVGIYATSANSISIRNNNIGAIDAMGNSSSSSGGITGINIAGTVGPHDVSSNTIGNGTNPNLRMGNLTTGANLSNVGTTFGTATGLSNFNGILNSVSSGTVTIGSSGLGNTIQNAAQNSTSSSTTFRGISTSGSGATATIGFNTINNISSGSSNTTFTSGGLAGLGIYLTSGTNPVITGNTISNLALTNTTTSGTNLAGISYTVPTTSISITRNKIYALSNASTSTSTTLPGTAAGLFIRDGAGVTTNINNNMISLGSGQGANTSFIGIWAMYSFSTSTTLKLYFNSINIEGLVTSGAQPSFGIYRGDFSTTAVTVFTMDVKNNILSNTRSGGTGKHYAIANNYGATASTTGWGTGASDYNVLNGTAANIGYWTTDRTFAAWQTASSGDTHSYSGITVTFVSSSTGDLHLNMGVSSTFLESHGLSGTGVTNDFDNDVRPGPSGSVNGGAIFPDLGADEFDGVPIDDIPPAITYTPLVNTTLTSNRTLAITVTDSAGVPTAGTGRPVIYFRKGVAGAFVSNTCVFVSGSSYNCQVNNSLIGGVVTGDTVQYYIAAQDNNNNVTTNPSTGASGFTANPPAASTPPTTPNSYLIAPAISGTKTVCATGCDYTTLTGATGAFNAINTSILTANLSIEIAGNLTTGEDGSVALNTIIEQPAGSNFLVNIFPTGTARIITSTTAPAGGFIRLNGADRVRINGAINGVGTTRSLTINESNTGTTSAVIWLQSNGTDGATNNTIRNINIVGNATATTLIGIGMGGTGTTSVSASSLGTSNNSNTIQNNNISKCQYGIYTQGASAVLKNTGNVITQNLINTASPNNVSKGILVGFEDGISITNNNLNNLTGSLTSYAYGISLGLTATTTLTTTGNEVTNATVTGNLIGTVRPSSTFGVAGIMVASATSGTTLIANNAIADAQTNGTTGDIGAGIYIGGGTGSTTNVYFNSVSMANTLTGGAYSSFAIAINGSNPVVNMKDNVLTSTGSTGANLNRAIGLAYSTFTNLVSDKNDLFVSGTGSAIGQTGTLANSGFTPSPSLLNWQTNTGKDPASINSDPLYNNAISNLQPQTGSPVLLAGVPITGITTDILGVTRNATTPTMGAYETSIDTQGPAISYTALINTTSTSNRTLATTITDASGVPTSGTGLPAIYFRKGISGAYATTQCTFVSGSAYDCLIDYTLVTGGSVTVGDTLQYYVAAQDIVNNVSVNPSAGASGFMTDPPAVSVPPTTPSSYLIVAAISGTKTICSSSCDYTTLTGAGGAFASINASAATGNLVLQIAGDLTVGEDGSNGLNALTEEPSGSNFTVAIYPTGVARAITGSASGALIKINGADRVTLDGSIGGTGSDRSLTITNTNTGTASAVVSLVSPNSSDPATLDTVRNTNLTGSGTTQTFAGLFMGGTTISTSGNALAANSNNTIQNNQISKAQYGVYAIGVSTLVLDQNTLVSGNTVGVAGSGNGTSIGGIVTRFQQGAVVSGNDVQNVSGAGSTNLTAVILQDSKSSSVLANRLHGVAYTGTSTTKIYVVYSTNSAFNSSGNPSNNTFANNAVYDITSACTSAVWCMSGLNNEGAYGDKYLYNSVSLSGVLTGTTASGPSVSAFTIGTPSVSAAATSGGFDIRNNSLAVTGSGNSSVTFYAHETTLANYTTSTLNNNDLYVVPTGTAVGKVGRINAADSLDLAAWKTATGQESLSISTNPQYNSSTNLQPQPGSPLVGAGTPVSVTVDITGASRSGSAPTIGAWETALDTSGPAIAYTPFGNTTSTANRTLTATITDISGVPTSGTGLPVVYLRKGPSGAYAGSQCSYVSGSTYSCVLDYSLVTGGSVMAGDTVQYFVAAQDNGAIVSVQPSAGAGGFTSNPPAAGTPPTNPSSYLIATAYTGSYNVGTGETITSLTNPGGLFEAINNGVLTGNVTVDLTSNLTGESGSVALNQWAEEGTGGYTLLIRPSGVARTITGTGTGSTVIKLNGADRFTLDGSLTAGTDRSLTISNPNTATGTTVLWVGSTGVGAGATNDTIKNCIVQAGTIGSTSVVTFGVFVGDTTGAANGADNDNLTLQNNQILKSTIGIQAIGATTGLNDNPLITGNTIGDAVNANSIGRIGMNVGQSTGATISLNTITNINTSDPAITSSNNATGMILGSGLVNSTVTRNTISGMRYTSTAGYGGKGMDINTGSTTSNLTVSNNFISDIAGDGWSDLTSDSIVGLRIQGTTGGVKLYHNSVNLGGGSFAGNIDGTASAALFLGSSTTGLDIRNNIFATNLNNTATASDKTYAIATAATTNSIFTTVNYNDYFVSGSASFVGLLNAIDRLTLANWRTASGQDLQSVAGDPLFLSATNLHLNISGGPSAAENVGTPIAAVTIDIDGDSRSGTAPDLGADEVDRCLNVICGAGTACSSNTCDQVDGICKVAFLPPTTLCRASVDVCDAADFCTGSNAACPADAKSTAICRGAAGLCDISESCDGIADTCPADVIQPVNTSCRAAGGVCDLAEVCDGSSAACPADLKSTAQCRGSAGDCDVAESCDGVGNNCPADGFLSASNTCRASAGACDLAETCPGNAAACPSDAKSTAECRVSAGDCDVAESCDGVADTCPGDLYRPATYTCRPSAAICDPAEMCTGAGVTCPADMLNQSAAVGNSVAVAWNSMTLTASISWTEANPGPFNVYRGSRRSGTSWAYNQACLVQGLSGPSATDTVMPSPGMSFYYLVTRREYSCPESSLGMASDLSQRPNTYACPNYGIDSDFDGVIDVLDNCPAVSNTGQLDFDSDSYGDACDNCPLVFNPDQTDTDNDTIGDACE